MYVSALWDGRVRVKCVNRAVESGWLVSPDDNEAVSVCPLIGLY